MSTHTILNLAITANILSAIACLFVLFAFRATTARSLLKRLDRAASNLPPQEARSLWWILTALRGPDNQDISTKMNITAVIRYHALPLWHKRLNKAGSLYPACEDDTHYAASFRKNYWDTEHFRDHAQEAFVALGMLWSAKNKTK